MTSTRRRPARGVRRWSSTMLAFVVMAMMVAPLVNSVTATAAPLEADLKLISFSPISVEDGKTIRLSGTFTSNTTLDDVTVRFEVGSTAFVSRSSIAEAASTPPITSPVVGADDALNKVRRGETKNFRIAFPADDLPLSNSGVFPMRIVAVDTSQELASVSSFLPWAPSGVGPEPSRLLMLWPVIGDSELLTGSPDESQYTDELLNSSFASAGRLTTLVSSGARAPATWVVDPALLDEAADVGTPAAQDWLDKVGAASEQRPFMALPYGDPDLAAVGEAGRPGFLVQGRAKGERVFARVLGIDPRADLGWPADGAGDEDTIATAARAGDAFVLLDAENAPLVTPETYTPSGRIEWPDPEVDVLLADEPASALVASPATTDNDVLLARQRFLAETFLHSLELPDDSRLLVLATPRRWDPSEDWANELVEAVRHANWINPVTMDQAVKPSVVQYQREAPSIPEDASSRQLPASMVISAQSALTDNRRLAAILTKPAEVTPPIEDDLFTSVSTAWRTDRVAAEDSQQETLDKLRTLRGKVRIVSQGGTLASDRGLFPVSLRNEFDQAVRVRLAVDSTDPLRLRASGPEGIITIGPLQSISEDVELDAVTSGRLSFDAQLETPGGADYDDPVTVSVDVRGFGRITLLVFGAAVVLLVLAAGLRIIRRIRKARRGAA